MEEEKSIWLKNLKDRGKGSFRNDLLVFSFFLVVSFIFWYVNSLRKELEVDLKYPVSYINPPAGRNLKGNLPDKINLNLYGPGYSIIRLKLSGSRAPLIVDFSKVTYKSVPDGSDPDFYILTGSLIPNFTRQLRSEFRILTVKPDTLFVRFEMQDQTQAGFKNLNNE